mgnify:CR=1 FL=1
MKQKKQSVCGQKGKTFLEPKLLVWIMVLLVTVHLVTAIGIRPARTSIAVDDFIEPEIKYEGRLWVVNNDQREFSVNIYVEGEMASFVKLKTPEKKLSFRSDDNAKEVGFELQIKKDEVPPGASTANIVIEETLDNLNSNVVSSKVILKHKINIQGPYPDKYIEIQINFHQQADKIEFVSEVKNLGKKEIQKLQTKFYVNDKEQKQQELKTETTSLPQKESKLLKTDLAKDKFNAAGEYEVTAITTYDDQQLELYKSLVIGNPEVEISYFDKYFIAYKVNQYTLDLLNKWNKIITNVYVDVRVLKDGREIDSFRTKSVDIEGEMIRRISDYLDAKDKGPGRYTFEMSVKFWNLVRMDERKFTFGSEFVTEEDAKALNLGAPALVGAAVGASGAGFSTMFPWLLAGMLLGIIGLYTAWRYMNKEKYEDGNRPF